MSNFVPQTRKFDHYDPIFENKYEKVAPEFGELHQKKIDFLLANAGKFDIKPDIPLNIEGLVPRTKVTQRIPSTMRWFRRTTSFERNGMFNIQTPVMNGRVLAWTFFIFIAYGWMGFQVSSWNSVVKKDSQEIKGTPYDKLSCRELPPTKLWTRPG